MISSKSKICHGVLFALMLALVCVALSAAQQPDQKQRPRRVTDTDTKTKSNSNDNAPAMEEGGEGDVVRVDTQLVSVPAIVTGNNGHPLMGLRAENFTIYEDGQKQAIANFGTTETPFEIALFLDTS